MPPESQRLGPVDQLTELLMRGLRRFFYYVFWRWPVDAATWLGTMAFDRPYPTLVAASPAIVFVAGVWLVTAGAAQGLWYPALVTMWANEEVARRNVAVARDALARWERERPARVRARMMTRDEQAEVEHWRAHRADIAAVIEAERQGVPSWWSPYPAEQPGRVARDVQVLYHADHVLFDTPYPFVPLGFLLLGMWRGWRQSRRRRRLQWEDASRAQSHDQVLLGLDAEGEAHFLEERVRPHHLLVVGTTGSGKSVALEHLARADIHAGRGLLFVDLKGERSLTEAVYRACVEAGRTQAFRLFTLDGQSHSYNPLGRGDATALGDRILTACVWSDEVFYKNAAASVMGRYLPAMLHRGGRITVLDLYHLLTERLAPPLVARWVIDEDARRAEDDTADWLRFQKCTASLLDNVAAFAARALRDRLCVPYADIDLAEALSEDLVVVFELSSQMWPKAAPTLARMVLEDLKHVGGSLARDRRAQKRFHVYLDEAGRGVYLGFAGLIAQCRSAGIGLTLAAQAPADFDTDEGKLMTTVLQNTGTKLMLRQLDPDSAELCARLGGTYETYERTRQLVDQGLLGTNESGVESERPIDKYIVHPNLLKRLRTGRGYLVDADTRVLVDLCPPARSSRESAELAAPPPTRRAAGPVLDLPRLVAEERRRIAEENRRAAGKKDGPSKDKTGEAKTHPNLAPVSTAPPNSLRCEGQVEDGD